MKITIENFGPIKEFEFDTEKDLTLIFGKNSVGKSYAISLVYLILKNIPYQQAHCITRFKEVDCDIDSLLKELKENNIEEFDISNYVEKHLTLYFKYFLKSLNESLINTFNKITDLQNQFISKKSKITIDKYDSFHNMTIKTSLELQDELFNIVNISINNSHSNIQFLIMNITHSNLEPLTNRYISFFSKNDNNQIFIDSYHTTLIELANIFFRESEPSQTYYLPASRSGLYQALSAFSQIFAELAKRRNFISKPIMLPAISEPVADYFLYLSNINSSDNRLKNYTDEIEKEILNGVVEFDTESKKILFIPNKSSLKLDVSVTSSMVSEISPIVSYLKYILSPISKPIIFIEEPEAHLHPETQVKLMRVFARLVKDNKIKLVMTSHSNYIFNAASNLVMDNTIPIDKFEAVLFEMTEEGSIARPMATDDYGIDDDNFIDTAESLYEEKLELINKLNG